MNYFFSLLSVSFFSGASLTISSALGAVVLGSFATTSIPIFFLIFSAILADLPVLSLR